MAQTLTVIHSAQQGHKPAQKNLFSSDPPVKLKPIIALGIGTGTWKQATVKSIVCCDSVLTDSFVITL